MAVTFRCPGTGGRARAPAVHDDACCARFAVMSAQRRADAGIAVSGPVRRADCPQPPRAEVLSVPELAAAVEAMQRRATEFPDEEPPGASLVVEYGPSHTERDILALYDLGRPYNLVLGYRRVPNDPEGVNDGK